MPKPTVLPTNNFEGAMLGIEIVRDTLQRANALAGEHGVELGRQYFSQALQGLISEYDTRVAVASLESLMESTSAIQAIFTIALLRQFLTSHDGE